MKNMGRKVYPAVAAKEVIECVDATCDICGKVKTRGNPTSYTGECNWYTPSNFGVSQTTVAMEEGWNYPEGGRTTVTSFQICPTCFKNVLIPYFESFTKPGEREVEKTVYEREI